MTSLIKNIIPVILCGGNGTRLWPLSRKNHPKQFIDYNNSTLLENTIQRAKRMFEILPILVGNKEHEFLLRKYQHNTSAILLEDISKNTALAITYAAMFINKNINIGENNIMLVMSSDHEIKNELILKNAIYQCKKSADNNKLITFSTTATYPSTAYGYIAHRKNCNSIPTNIIEFKEKPSITEATEMLKNTQYTYQWNTGIFMFKSRSIFKWSKFTCERYI